MPAHTHPVNANSGAQTAAPVAATSYPGSGNLSVYGAVPNTAMNALIVGNIGGSQAHTNMQPFLVLNFIIALQGIFPSQN
jgi:microcystin-dependent protein